MMNRAYTYSLLQSLSLLVVAMSVGLVSCSKDAADSEPGDGQIRINAVVATSQQVGAKAPVVDGGAGAKAVLTGIRMLREDGPAVATTFTSFATATPQIYADRSPSGELTFTPAQYYQRDNATTSYIAAHPEGSIVNLSGDKGLIWLINGAADILISKVYNAGKYTAPTSGTTMVFEHHMAQLRVVCTADPSMALSAVTSAWGKITKIELMGTWESYVFYPSKNPHSMGGSGEKTTGLWNPSYTSQTLAVTLAKNTTTHCAAGMFPPKSGTTPLKLKVYSEKETNGIEVEVQLKDGATNKGFERGKIHTVTLTFGAADKSIVVETTSIKDWEDGGTGSGDGIVFEDVFTPSDGIIDMNYADLVKVGKVNSIWFTATPTRRSYNSNTYNASNADNNGGYATTTQQANAEPAYYKFEVAKDDEVGVWTKAWDACKAKAPAGAWRLPRTMELALIGFNRTELEKTPGFTPLGEGSYYLSAKEWDATSMWGMSLPGFSMDPWGKNVSFLVRCVRELDLSLPEVEDYFYSDGTFSRKFNADKTIEGVVFWVNANNPKHFKIVSMDAPPAAWDGGTNDIGRLIWGPSDILVGANSASNGKANTLKVMQHARASEHKAFLWCYKKNTGLNGTAASAVTVNTPAYQWYLPAQNEMDHLYCAYRGVAPTTWGINVRPGFNRTGYPAAWNARFTTPFEAHYHWTSTEASYANGSTVIYFPDGHKYQNTGKDLRYIRCAREITLP